MPFCSQRCRLVDLGRWLDEKAGNAHRAGRTKEAEPQMDADPLLMLFESVPDCLPPSSPARLPTLCFPG